MAIPSTGSISMGAIQTEFGGSNPIGLNEYYAGGAYVPSGTSGTNGAVPSSGTIAFSKFYGTQKITLVDTQTVTAATTGPFGSPPYGPFTSYTGYIRGSQGSISDGTSNIWSPAVNINDISRTTTVSFPSTTLYQSTFSIGAGKANAGWTSMTDAGGVSWPRTSASFSNTSSSSSWNWNGGINFNAPGTFSFYL